MMQGTRWFERMVGKLRDEEKKAGEARRRAFLLRKRGGDTLRSGSLAMLAAMRLASSRVR